jgi:hypothetical protein
MERPIITSGLSCKGLASCWLLLCLERHCKFIGAEVRVAESKDIGKGMAIVTVYEIFYI